MGSITISAKTLAGAVEKARDLGIYEELVQLSEECGVCLRSLRPTEYDLALAECKGLEGMEYLYTFQKSHVSRAICELNGQSLREVKFVEVDEPDPKDPNKVKSVKLELYAYLRKYLIDTWSKEVLYVAYRKFGDIVAEAERRSKEGIKFVIAEETQEERLRRLLGEVREVEAELPPELADRTLVEFGYMHHTTAEQAKNIDDRLASVASPETAAQAPQVAPEAPTAAVPDPVRLMRTRMPLNRTVEETPLPPAPAPRWAPQTDTATSQAAGAAPQRVVPGAAPSPVVQPRAAQAPAVLSNPQTLGGPAPMSRSARIAALEAGADADTTMTAGLLTGSSMGHLQTAQVDDVPVLTGRSNDKPDPATVIPTIDNGPKVGLNPLYRPPPR